MKGRNPLETDFSARLMAEVAGDRAHFERETQHSLQEMLASLGQAPLSGDQARLVAAHLALLVRWNAKINLTAVRSPEEMLSRHFVESILCARLLPAGIETLLDFGSGGGFPGVPCAICRPEMHVTLAESQGRKAAFLREVLRTLDLAASVYHGRVEEMPIGTNFDAVILRAVDRMLPALAAALVRVKAGGWLAVLATSTSIDAFRKHLPGVIWMTPKPIAGRQQGVLLLGRKGAASL